MDIKEALNMWQDIPFTWMRKFTIVKMSNLPRWMHKSNTIPKTQWHILLNLTVNSEVHMGEMYIKIAKIVLKRKNEPCMCVWELGLTKRKATFVPDFSSFKCSFSLRLVIKSQGETIPCGWRKTDPSSTRGLGMWYRPGHSEEPTPLAEGVCMPSKIGWSESNPDIFFSPKTLGKDDLFSCSY